MNDREPTDEEIDAWNLSQIQQRPSPFHAKPIRSIMRRLMAQKGYAAAGAQGALLDAWSEAVGELRQFSTPGVIRRGTLYVTVTSHPVLNELQFQNRKILSQLQARMPEAGIKNIRFQFE